MARLLTSLRFKFALALGLFCASVLLLVMFLLEQDFRASLIRENIGKGVGIANIVALNAEDPLLTGDDLYLFSVTKNALLAPGIRYAAITDRNHKIRAADNMELIGKPFALAAQAEELEQSDRYRVRRTSDQTRTLLDITVPIVSKSDQSLVLGEIHLGLSEEILTRSVAKMRQTLLGLSLVTLIFGGIIAYLLAGVAVRPIHALVAGVKAVGEGNLDQHIALQRNDELGVLTDAFNEMTVSLREKEYIKHTFERYVSKQLAQQIFEHKDTLRLGGEEKVVTVLFCDLRDFTSLAEQLSPPEVVEFLNMYFTEVVAIVNRHDGMVDKFMGDAVMVLFGAPLPVGDEALKAVRCALEIRQAMERINLRLQQNGRKPIAVGIGINTGPVVAGNLGSQNRMEYTVIGDNVNIASRLESLNKVYGTTILVSESTRNAIHDQTIPFREIDLVQIVGKKIVVKIFELSEISTTVQNEFAKALVLYRDRQFATALELFTRLEQTCNDPPAQTLAGRCKAYLVTPPASNWNGIYIADSK